MSFGSLGIVNAQDWQCETVTNGFHIPVYQSNAKTNYPSACVNLKFHIVRTSAGLGGFNPANLESVMTTFRQAYQPHNIFLENAGFDFIDDNQYRNLDIRQRGLNLTQVNRDTNAIDIYIVESLWSLGGPGTHLGNAFSIISKSLVIREDRLNSSVGVHELGHCFGLYHTHEVNLTCFENIARDNCETCGDLLCDTPADNQIRNSPGYSTDTFNFMSTYEPLDLRRFSQGQGARMRELLNTNTVLTPVLSNSCIIPVIDEINSFCGFGVINIGNIGTNTATWQVSPNLEIVSFTSSSITVEPLSFNSTGVAWVEALITTGQRLRSTFLIGTPQQSNLTMTSSGSYDFLSVGEFYQLNAHLQGDLAFTQAVSFEWNIPYSQSSFGNNGRLASVQPTQAGTYPYKVRACNDCGCSDWLTRFFQVTENPSGGFYLIGN